MTSSARQGMPPDAINIHATIVVLGDRGVAITGVSGSGKTSLALSLVSHWRISGRFARLVSDDQAFVAARSGRLVAHAPHAIAGLAEVRGIGPMPAPFEPVAVVDLVVELIDQGDNDAIAPDRTVELAGVVLPVYRLPGRKVAAASLIVDAIVASMLRPNDQEPAHG